MGAKLTICGVLVAVVAFAGCPEAAPDGGPLTEVEITEFNVTMLEATWEYLALPEPAPETSWLDAPSLDYGDWWEHTYSCLEATELTEYLPGFTLGLGYYYDETEQTPAPNADQKYTWYRCLAQYRLDPSEMGYRSPRQMEYAYEYYQSWLVPCLEDRGLDVAEIPKRADFRAEGGWWSPYVVAIPQLTDYQRQAYVKDCGDDLSVFGPEPDQG